MTDEVYEKAKKLNEAKYVLRSANRIMGFPYPTLSISYAREQLDVDFLTWMKKQEKN